jgi:hypothetical protein
VRAAVALGRAGVAAAPGNPALRLVLGKALAQAGMAEEALDCLREAVRAFPDHEGLHQELAQGLARDGEVDAALACAGAREAPWAALFAFKLLVRHGRRAEAAAFEAAAAAARPADPDVLEWRAKRARGDPPELLRLCEEALRVDPGSAQALHYQAVALAQLGRDDEAAALMGMDRFLHAAPLAVPPGFGGGEAFLELLREEVIANPSLRPDMPGHATRSGLRTRTFPAAGDRAAPALIDALRAAAGAYAKALTGDHPFVRARPDRASLTPWALLFRSAGHQVLHHHPGCWLTGVFYVSLRREEGRADAGQEDGPQGRRAGMLRIGALPDWADVAPPWPVQEIVPVPGTLLLFPAFVPHETVPPGDGTERISVAFDVTGIEGDRV